MDMGGQGCCWVCLSAGICGQAGPSVHPHLHRHLVGGCADNCAVTSCGGGRGSQTAPITKLCLVAEDAGLAPHMARPASSSRQGPARLPAPEGNSHGDCSWGTYGDTFGLSDIEHNLLFFVCGKEIFFLTNCIHAKNLTRFMKKQRFS